MQSDDTSSQSDYLPAAQGHGRCLRCGDRIAGRSHRRHLGPAASASPWCSTRTAALTDAPADVTRRPCTAHAPERRPPSGGRGGACLPHAASRSCRLRTTTEHPNARRGSSAAREGQPHPKRLTARTSRPIPLGLDRLRLPEPSTLGMVGIQGNELTFRHHINSYFSDYGVVQLHRQSAFVRRHRRCPGREVWEDDQLLAIRDKGGCRHQHPGIPNVHAGGALSLVCPALSEASGQVPDRPEMANNGPKNMRTTRASGTLARSMPPAWGFGNDDMHEMKDNRQAFTVFFRQAHRGHVKAQGHGVGPILHLHVHQEDGLAASSPGPVRVPCWRRSSGRRGGHDPLEVSDCDQALISAPESLEPIATNKTSDRPGSRAAWYTSAKRSTTAKRPASTTTCVPLSRRRPRHASHADQSLGISGA